MAYKFKKYLSLSELSLDCILKLNILIEKIKENSLTNKKKSWYRFIFNKPISFYEIKKLFHIAEQLGFIKTTCFFEPETQVNYWFCDYIKSIPNECLPNFLDKKIALFEKKKAIKKELLKIQIQKNQHKTLKEIAKKINICYASAKVYYKELKAENLKLIKAKKQAKKPKEIIRENEELKAENFRLKQIKHQYNWFKNQINIKHNELSDNWITDIKNLIFIGKNHKEYISQLISELDYYKKSSSNKYLYNKEY